MKILKPLLFSIIFLSKSVHTAHHFVTTPPHSRHSTVETRKLINLDQKYSHLLLFGLASIAIKGALCVAIISLRNTNEQR